VPSPDLTQDEWALWDVWMTAQRLVAREADRRLMREVGISKTEFSVLVTLRRASAPELRVGELTEALGWEKSRVSHQLTRMEQRGLVRRVEGGAPGRRTGVALTDAGRESVDDAVRRHAGTVRAVFLDLMDDDQQAVLREWAERVETLLGDDEA
jgi:DNA-binding MarR family transcriptional regulator